jgi:phytoene dehydrogenase-like protein
MDPRGAQAIDTVVVGGGLAGLVAATTAAGPGRRVVLLEPHPPGGRARADHRAGFTFNRGPRALYLGAAGRPILEALGVSVEQGGTPAVADAQGRRDGELHLLPQGPSSLVRTSLLGAGAKVRMARALASFPKLVPSTVRGTSFGDVVAGMGLDPVGADVVRMIARVATYAADPDQLDAEAVVTNVQLALDQGVRYLDDGFQAIADGLVEAAHRAGVEVRAVGAATVRPTDGDRPASVTAADGTELEAATVVLAAGGPDVAERLLGAPVPGVDRLTAPVTAACLELGLRRVPRHRVVFGIDEPLYLSTHCPPARLAPPGHAVLHVMRNHHADEALDANEQRAWLLAAARQAGVDPGDVVEERFLARMVVTGGMPTPAGGGLPGRPAVEDPHRPGVLLAGDWVGPEGLLADAAISSGRAAGLLAARRTATMAIA